MALLIYTLEQYNIRQGSSIFRQQFLYYKKAAFRDRAREEIPQDKLTDERCVFDKLDKKHSGRISWEDFINSEAINMLRNRRKRKLVKLLTQAELFRCRQKFMEYDHDRDGEITRFESLKSQMKSYSDLSCFPTPTPSKLLYSNEEIGGVIDWMEFLQDQAITVIASRRNSFCKELPKNASESPKIPPRTPEVITRKRTNFVDSEVRNTLTEIVPALNTVTVISPVTSRSASPVPIGTVDVKSDTPAQTAQTAHSNDSKVSITYDQTLDVPPPVLLRSGRSKSAIVRSRAEKSPNFSKPVVRLNTTKSVDESAVETNVSNGHLIKSPNINLVEESAPQLLQLKHTSVCESNTENSRDQNGGVTNDINESTAILPETPEITLDSVPNTDPKDSTETVENNSDDGESIQRRSVEGEVDVVRRFPKSARNHTISMYIYESNRNTFGNEIRSIRRPVSVVGFKMEPTETVSRLSMNLRRPASSPHHSILPIIRKEIKNNGLPPKELPKSSNKDQEKTPKRSNKENAPPAKMESPRTSVSKLPSPLKQSSDISIKEYDVERRGKKRLNDDIVDSKCGGKYRASDSEVLKAEKVSKTNRSQTTSLFVTRNERALLIDQNDRRPLSLG
ncbi:hypothetical protein LOTGIDRAFT_233074 [Lottia gigantea]|uniref:EF-hand domain-containing protein n=1 Tax=Lottia gigantea TaxID=225164 RepID=V3ZMN3_LOTGI|nr:hypothetical protein LOTGIDRAFT_233074 [Lottia gigantea]ESO92633.1 hypothetical protein LOTGIDRAFT_233074 [Lottia gigantea]